VSAVPGAPTAPPRALPRPVVRPSGAARALGRLPQLLSYLVLLALLGLTLVPIGAMLLMSVKNSSQIYARFFSRPDPVEWANYAVGWEAIQRAMVNSLVASTLSVVFTVAVSAMSGYVFARHAFPGKGSLFVAVLALMMIPGILTLIPSYVIMGQLGLLNSVWALVLHWVAGGQIIGILLCRTFFATLPQELFDAARVDGASDLDMFGRIAVPLSVPTLVTIGIFHAVSTYNDYIWPLIVISKKEQQVVSVTLTRFTADHFTEYGPMMAAYALAIVPLLVLFLFGMRAFMEGIVSGSVKA
jgi:multiple sugar transport system permease protein